MEMKPQPPNAEVLGQLEIKERMSLRNDPSVSPRGSILFSVPSARHAQCKLPTREGWCSLALCSDGPVELSLQSINTCGLVT